MEMLEKQQLMMKLKEGIEQASNRDLVPKEILVQLWTILVLWYLQCACKEEKTKGGGFMIFSQWGAMDVERKAKIREGGQ